MLGDDIDCDEFYYYIFDFASSSDNIASVAVARSKTHDSPNRRLKMSKTIRFVLRGVRGRSRHNFNWPAIKSRQSVVNITAGEVKPAAPSQVLGGHAVQNFMYHLGNADVWVSNISPHKNDHFNDEPGGVEFILHVGNFDGAIDAGVTITVEDDVPVEIQN
jgi:hypothetical protein